ncbi:isoleucine--tRNA ligase [Candidatus Pantoea edessiphila]|uniref:Isoleucine--tRNA ligase n=1 Tax=Candidatus Pantoea edessiphila TaxID=2044610 RepID=A0A2P5SY87_9GAMM|nr:isoleucine--tRNA ligase [Candidatus Pantoea edessiphila]MBK4775612.1 isoleucine--tRNA ligase [Pantoea sp. Edef]PPI87260.1 isoleucine--tRNA ligase [Candidatus Pantoea edessiphila]
MIDYKSTLNLPKTNFPMKGNLFSTETEILNHWNNDNLYQVVREAKKGRKLFILHDGPPYANGQIHIGHAVNKILKDIIIKSKGLSGYDAPYIPGWDCHGLPIEHKIEQIVGRPGGNQASYANFRKLCRDFASEQVTKQKTDFIRLGVIGNWDYPYLTMNFKTEADIIRVLGKIISEGYLYRDLKPVHWCIDCCSSLAEAEVEYIDKISPAIDVMFKSINTNLICDIFGLKQQIDFVYLVIWTTTPWTIPANCAIALHPEFYYQLIKTKDLFLIIAKDLLESSLKRIGVNEWIILGECKGKQLEFKKFQNPIFDAVAPIILSNHITLDAGTGAVHIAPSHGVEDYFVAKKYGINNINIISPDGLYLKGTHPFLDNINIFKGNNIVINLLKNNNALLSNENISHSYPHCWRHKTPIIFQTTPQWFIDMNHKNLRVKLLKKVKNVNWIPNWGQRCIESMILNRPDWCISRQRIWGVPITLFIHKETQQLHPDTLDIIEKISLLIEKYGIQTWWDLDPETFIREPNNYLKVTDTLDVWFDSGSTICTIVGTRSDFRNKQPDMYLEGLDQFRGWFMSSLIISTVINNKAPFRQVLTQCFAVDCKGRKMSKSIGNVISPKDVIKKFGADVLRFWVAATDYSTEMNISDSILNYSVDSYRKIRNSVRFILANLHDFNSEVDLVSPNDMLILDKWAVGRAQNVQKDIISLYDKYEFHTIIKRLIYFCSVEMSSFYFDIIKDRQYTMKRNSPERRSCQTALWHIIEALVRWIAPILSFTADEIWNHLLGDRTKYVFADQWYKNLFGLSDNDILNDNYWKDIINIRSEVNKVIEQARKNKFIGSSLEADVKLYVGPKLYEQLGMLGQELKFVLLTSNVQILKYKYSSKVAYKSEIFKDLNIECYKAEGDKCPRCWHYTKNIQNIAPYIGICNRCHSNLIGNGEKRKFV